MNDLYSYSEIAMYMRCPEKFKYSRMDNLEAVGHSLPREKGSWFHVLMMEDLSGNDWREAHRLLWEEWDRNVRPFTLDEELMNLPDEVERLFVSYKTKYPDDFARYKVLHVEESMSFELYPGVSIGFTPDLVVEDEYGGIWCWDHKTTANLPQEGEMLIDLQNLTYTMGLRAKYGSRFKGFVFNYTRTKVPTTPRLRKDGLIADVRRIDTTYEVLLQFAADNGIKPYPELTEKLAWLVDHDNYFRRDYFIVPDEALVNARRDLISWVVKLRSDIEINAGGGPGGFGRVIMHRSAGVQACVKCPFYQLCQNDLLGIDNAATMLDYKEREPLDREYTPIETEVE